MARQLLPIAGAFVGSFFGPMGAQIGFAIGSLVGNAVDPQVIKGPKLGEAGLQTSAEGVFRPVVLGTGAIKGNIIERGNRQVHTNRTRQSKGGGPVTEEQRVYWTFAIRVCEGPIAAVTRIWMDEKLVYDIRPGSTIPAESAEFASRFRLYLGDEDQLPDPDLEVIHGIGNANAYRGTAYTVWPNFDLTDYRERIPDFRFEVASNALPVEPSDLIVGPEFLAAGPDAPSGYLTLGGDGLPYALSGTADGNWLILPGDTYITSYYDAVLNEVGTEGFTFPGTGAGGEAYLVVAVNDSGWALFSDSSGGSCRLAKDGEIVADLRPEEDTPLGWWFGEYNFSPEYGGLAWFYGGKLILGVRETGTTGVNWNRVFTFPLVDSGDTVVPASTSIHVSDDTAGPRFWMHVSRQGVVRTINTALEFQAWDDSLSPIMLGESLPAAIEADITGLIFAGFGVDESFDLAAYVTYTDELHLYRHSSGELLETYSLVGAGGSANVNTRVVFGPQGLYVQRKSRTYVVPLVVPAQGAAVPLSQVVSFLHARVGQPAPRYDVSELTEYVEGIVFAGDYTAADAVRTLMPIYFFDGPEYDDGTSYRIRYVKRGKPVVAVIEGDDLIDAVEKTVREDSLERPRALHLHYENPTVGYVPAKATVKRNSTDVLVVGEQSVQVPVSFSDVDIPRQIADKLLRIAWVQVAGEEEFTLGDNFLSLIPSDNIGLSLRGQVRRLRIEQEQVIPGAQRYRMILDRQSAYTSNVTGIPVPEPTPPPPSIVGQTVFEFLDIPALNDNNDRLLYYVAVAGQTEAWYGALVQRALPPDTAWEDVARFTLGTVMGETLAPVGIASEHYTDTTHEVIVALARPGDAIDSLTEQQFLSEGGSFALEKPDGSWEVMQYRDAEEQTDGSFRLSTLLRGRLNSGPSDHLVGARFVLLDGVQSVDALVGFLGRDLMHRAISFGTSPEAAPTATDPYIGKSQQEFPVAHLLLSRDGASVTARAVPRHRFGTEDHPVRSINWQGYRWTATDGVNVASIPDSVGDTITFDATGWASPVTVTVAQVNRITGPSPTVSEQIA
jgi:hypothetical protein